MNGTVACQKNGTEALSDQAKFIILLFVRLKTEVRGRIDFKGSHSYTGIPLD